MNKPIHRQSHFLLISHHQCGSGWLHYHSTVCITLFFPPLPVRCFFLGVPPTTRTPCHLPSYVPPHSLLCQSLVRGVLCMSASCPPGAHEHHHLLWCPQDCLLDAMTEDPTGTLQPQIQGNVELVKIGYIVEYGHSGYQSIRWKAASWYWQYLLFQRIKLFWWEG